MNASRIGLVAIVSVLVLATAGMAVEDPSVDYAALAKACQPALVKVAFTVQFDVGEPPRAVGYAQKCPNCGAYHSFGTESLVSEERPLELSGFAISPTTVVIADPILHPRFIKSVAVQFGEQNVQAKIVGYGKDQGALLLELASPLKDVKPLKFNAQAKAPFYAVTYSRTNGVWTTSVVSLSKSYAVTEQIRQFQAIPGNCLIVTETGEPVALSMKAEIPNDDSWKGSPAQWAMLTADQMAAQLKSVEEKSKAGILRVALSFRSPKKGGASGMTRMSMSSDDENATERNVLGLLLDDTTVAVLVNLKPNYTARLERIKVYPAQGEPVAAKFQATLSDYGCFLVKLDTPLSGAIPVSSEPLPSVQNQLVMSAEIKLQGEKLVCYYLHGRIPSLRVGWKNNLYPEISGPFEDGYFFDTKGALLAMPVIRRAKAGSEDRYDSSRATLTPVSYLKSTLGDLAKNSDKNNVPLGEEEENRLAWLGVVLQPLDKELARANNVSQQTRDGSTGALVSYVYPGSPADKAGIKQGYVFLRLHFKDQPKPVEIRLEGMDRFSSQAFPWDRLDTLPEQYYDQVPPPWPSAEDTTSRLLTDYGFGKPFVAEFFHDGQVDKKNFAVELSPPHYDTAPRYKSAELGITVRDLTYEMRRYFQKKDDEPGVVISKEEPGSKASIAGLKPFEIVTHIDGQPVMNVRDFQKLVKQQGEIRLSINRMTKGRQVKIDLGSISSQPASAPASQAATP